MNHVGKITNSLFDRTIGGGQTGFTLIELMIVVGILGILVSVTGPTYERYLAKARQSEAKLALSAIYSLENSFYSEYGSFIPSMDAIGYQPEGLKRFYVVGWYGADYTGTVSGYGGQTTTAYYDRINFPAQWTTDCATLYNGWNANGGGNNQQTLHLTAEGIIRNGTACDRWLIYKNQPGYADKTLVNNPVGL